MQISIAKTRPGQVTACQIGALPGANVFQPFLMLCNDDADFISSNSSDMALSLVIIHNRPFARGTKTT